MSSIKKTIYILTLACFCLSIAIMSVFAEEKIITTENDESNDLFRKVVVYNFETALKKEKEKYFSEIIPDNLAKELERTGKYFVEISKSVVNIVDVQDKQYSAYLNDLASKAVEFSADYILTGSFRTRRKTVYVLCHIYIARLNKIIKISVSRKNLGVFLSGLIDELSQKVDIETSKYNKQKSGVPYILPKGGIYSFHKQITIKSDLKDAEIWYSLNGSKPKRSKSKKQTGPSFRYTKPFDIYKSQTVKAVAYKKGYEKSDVATQHYKIKDPVRSLVIGAMWGKLQYIGDWKDNLKNSKSTIATGYGYWELSNIKTVRKVPVLRNFALLGASDMSFTELEESTDGLVNTTGIGATTERPLRMNYWSFYGGLMYKIRIGHYVSLNLSAGYGVAAMQLTSDNKHNGYTSYFVRPMKLEGAEWSFPYFSSGINVEVAYGPVFCVASVSYKHIFVKKDDELVATDNIITDDKPMKAIAYQGGVGIRF